MTAKQQFLIDIQKDADYIKHKKESTKIVMKFYAHQPDYSYTIPLGSINVANDFYNNKKRKYEEVVTN